MTTANNPDSKESEKLPIVKRKQQTVSEKNTPRSQNVKLPPLTHRSEPALSTSNNKNPKNIREETSYSQESTGSKKIIKWSVWWDKPESNLRVPSYPLPPKDVPSKIGSLEKVSHKPGGGNKPVLNEKLQWPKVARTDHVFKGYRPGGGNRQILNEKLEWKTTSKIGSLENVTHHPGGGNVEIIDQPFRKKGIKPRIDSGLIYEEVIVPVDYQIRTTPRINHLEPIHESIKGQRSIKN